VRRSGEMPFYLTKRGPIPRRWRARSRAPYTVNKDTLLRESLELVAAEKIVALVHLVKFETLTTVSKLPSGNGDRRNGSVPQTSVQHGCSRQTVGHVRSTSTQARRRVMILRGGKRRRSALPALYATQNVCVLKRPPNGPKLHYKFETV
jgi:hypothetical protein